ncbi:FitA-like ribbon-helix-helix domain-containing protein [Rhodobium gokarnense]|uniref:Plasmid stability protein n=1 Tax=Rhodobium gokarnense TaxID=364296 RepID=A0ABT3H822_9HYPH|nr:plasmid stabilization protein [Rhodobium gokarnense]MCW2306529.1 plasmid stability protein [Rhodobium gokarnense]
MADLLIRNIDPGLKERLRQRAEAHRRSLSDEVKALLGQQLAPADERKGLGTRIHELFAPLGGVDLELPEDQFPEAPPRFE